MKIAILGAGAIGGLLGVHLSKAGARVTLIDRAEHAQVLRANGVAVLCPDGSRLHVGDVSVRVAGDPQEVHDLVILAVKAHQIGGALVTLEALLGPDTTIVTVQNGIPWWYFKGLRGAFHDRDLALVDPDGRIGRAIDPKRVVGCVVYPAAAMVNPGVIHHVEGNRFTLGELDGRKTDRSQEFSQLLTASGFKAPITDDIRAEIWLKAWGNLAFNPISALTRASLAAICRYPPTRELAANMMREAQQIAERLGVTFRVTLERRLQGAEQVGEHKTSMLQDLEAGRPLELDAIVGAVLEIGRLVGVATPTIEAVYELTRLLDRTITDPGSSR